MQPTRLLRLLRGQRERELRARAGLTLGPDPAAVVLDDPSRRVQPDARAEQPRRVRGVEADAVVTD